MNPKATSRIVPSSKSSLDTEEDFVICFMDLYSKFSNPISVTILTENRTKTDNSQKLRYIKTIKMHGAVASIPVTTDDEGTLPITAVYDTQNRLSAILMADLKEETIPRVIMQLLAFILPNYQQLSKFTIKNCRIAMYVVHELGKMLPYTTITDVCLDGCLLKQANYEELLQKTTCLQNLSLSRCNINDEVCERIAATLHYLQSAENSLVTLNLSSNDIGDEGAKYFAEALRSNRHLRYLNLADNHISDEGAGLIFNIFKEFSLTYDENLKRQQRLINDLKKKRENYLASLHNLVKSTSFQKSTASSQSNASKLRSNEKIPVVLPVQRTGSSLSQGSHTQVKRKCSKRQIARNLSLSCLTLIKDLPQKAESPAGDLLGPFVDPYCPSSVRSDDNPRCIGNFVLCYLNLAYNDLTFLSIKKLLSVVEYQKVHCNPDDCGLLKVVLDGNSLPVACPELVTIQEMLNQHVASFQSNKASRKSGLYKGCQRGSITRLPSL